MGDMQSPVQVTGECDGIFFKVRAHLLKFGTMRQRERPLETGSGMSPTPAAAVHCFLGTNLARTFRV